MLFRYRNVASTVIGMAPTLSKTHMAEAWSRSAQAIPPCKEPRWLSSPVPRDSSRKRVCGLRSFVMRSWYARTVVSVFKVLEKSVLVMFVSVGG